jgi:hypothetical protein
MNIISYIVSFLLAGLAFYPAMPFQIPASIIVTVNSFVCLYVIMFSGFVGFTLLTTKLPLSLKILAVYLWVVSFFSAAPYLSFNCYILIVLMYLLFMFIQKCRLDILLNVLQMVFWYQMAWGFVQLFGKDVLINFHRPQPVFLGTILQIMRFGSLLAILAPFLILKNKWYIIPLAIVGIIIHKASFGLAILGGTFVYLMLRQKKHRLWIALSMIALIVMFTFYTWESWRAALLFGRFPWWHRIIDTMMPRIWTGWGMGTFTNLFGVLLNDPGAFAQAHSDHLQTTWEVGLIGYGLIMAYAISLIRKLYQIKSYLLIAGLVCIAINMAGAFPCRMSQSVLLIIAFLGICQQTVNHYKEKG